MRNLEEIFAKKNYLVPAVVLVILGFAVYTNSLGGKFVWDDHILIKDNIYIKSFSHIGDIFTKDFGQGAGVRYHFYRPLQIFSYLLECHLWGLNPAGYHFVNVVLHILVGLCIFWFIILLSGDYFLALLASVFFIIHPIHTETVSYISDRGDLLSALFMLLCLILYIKYINKRNVILYVFMILSYILALLSKENSLALPMAFLAYHFSFRKKIRLSALTPFIIIVFLYITGRIFLVQSSVDKISVIGSFYQRLPGFFVAIVNYIRLLFLPVGLHIEYGDPLFKWFDYRTILGVAISALLLIVGVRKSHKNAVLSFSILWFFIFILPFSNIYPLPFYMAEHYLYLPSIGFFLILSWSLCYLYRLRRYKAVFLAIAAVLLAFWSGLAIRQNRYWREPIILYKHALIFSPRNSRIYHNLGDAYTDMGYYKKAVAAYKNSIKFSSFHADTYTSLGVVYSALGKYKEAVDSYKHALEINPVYVNALNGLGAAYYAMGEEEKAISLYKKALSINPLYAKAYLNLGIACYTVGEKDKAVRYYEKALKTDPHYAEAYNNLGVIYNNSGKTERALSLFSKAIAAKKDYADAYYNIGISYNTLGRIEDAINMFEKAISIDPKHYDAYYNLGVLYMKTTRHDEAIKMLKKSIEIKPQADAYYNLALIYFNKKEYRLAVKYYDKAFHMGIKNNNLFKALEPYRDSKK